MGFDQRDAMVAALPGVFAVTPHYQGHEWVLVRLATVGRARLADLLAGAWREAAPARLRARVPGP
jgi:hypothetical protein